MIQHPEVTTNGKLSMPFNAVRVSKRGDELYLEFCLAGEVQVKQLIEGPGITGNNDFVYTVSDVEGRIQLRVI